jgi:uncharacterized peroxidase-related enzyme
MLGTPGARSVRSAMTYVETVPEAGAPAPVAAMYAADRERLGTLPNFTRAFSLRPEVYAAWRALHGAIAAHMEPRRYELATLAAARRLRSSYCALAHGAALLRLGLDPDAVCDGTGLSETEIAVMELAAKVAGDAQAVTRADLDRLRALGLDDAEIVDVVLTAAARCFFSTVLDGLGTEPDAAYAERLPPRVLAALTVGRRPARARP